MIRPLLQDDAFLADVRAARRDATNTTLYLWWLGQSGFLVQCQGRHLLLDPYLSDSLTRKYAQSDKPHIRMSERVVDPGRLDFVDVVTSSHNHTDHLDAETLQPLRRANPALQCVIGEANRATAVARLGYASDWPHGLDVGDSIDLAGFRITAVAAAHEDLERDEHGRHRYLGYVIEVGPWTIYHSGDTVRFPGMVEGLRRWKIDIALLPINGRALERRVAGNLNATEAAELGEALGVRWVVPCHYDLFTFNTADPAEFVRAAQARGVARRVLQLGERWSLP